MLQQAIAMHKKGQLNNAETLYNRVLQNQPNNFTALHLLGTLKHQAGDNNAAMMLIKKALEINPEHAGAYSNLGIVLKNNGQPAQARKCFLKALQLAPDNLDVKLRLANVLQQLNLTDAAIMRFKQILEVDSNHLQAMCGLANVLRKSGQYDEAESIALKATQLDPSYGNAFCNLGCVYHDNREFSKAEQAFLKAIDLDPYDSNAHNNLGLLYLISKRFEKGWQQYEWRWNTNQLSHAHQYADKPFWQGEPLEGKHILVWTEQGFGDSIFAIRYLNDLQALKPKQITVQCRDPLRTLFQQSYPDIQFVNKQESTELEFDAHCPIMSLPGRFTPHFKDIPGDTPYLKVDQNDKQKWAKRLESHKSPKVGLVWAGNPSNGSDKHRSVTLEDYKPLLELDTVTYVSLQVGPRAVDVETEAFNERIIHFSDELKNFHDTACVIEQLDMVICVDTSVAHLSGGLNTPVFTLHRFLPDWRWFLTTKNSPWYPSMRLFRQTEKRDWQPVIAELKKAVVDYFKLKS